MSTSLAQIAGGGGWRRLSRKDSRNEAVLRSSDSQRWDSSRSYEAAPSLGVEMLLRWVRSCEVSALSSLISTAARIRSRTTSMSLKGLVR